MDEIINLRFVVLFSSFKWKRQYATNVLIDETNNDLCNLTKYDWQSNKTKLAQFNWQWNGKYIMSEFLESMFPRSLME